MDSPYSYDEGSLQPLLGRSVCVIMNDHTRYTGILTSYSSSSIVLNGERTERPVARKRKSKAQAEVSNVNSKEYDSSTAYWGELSLSPAMEVSTVKSVIPLHPIIDIIPI